MWLTADTLRNGAASGHYYENYVVMELVKNYAYAKSKVNITYFRDSNAKEIDVFVEENNVIHPLEIKKSASPDRRDVKKYSIGYFYSLSKRTTLYGQLAYSDFEDKAVAEFFRGKGFENDSVTGVQVGINHKF